LGISADAAPPAVWTLLETANTEVIFHLEAYVDSGIRRATDVVRDRCFCAKSSGCWILGWKSIFDILLTLHIGIPKYSIRNIRL
jgi:hypothetical protein